MLALQEPTSQGRDFMPFFNPIDGPRTTQEASVSLSRQIYQRLRSSTLYPYPRLRELHLYAKFGTVSYPNRASSSSYVPEPIVLVGHSLGSLASDASVAQKPDIDDGVVLSGWGYDSGVPNVSGWLPLLHS
ncbi:uncharacterized protein RSE6_08077 [Rhynchosporium secalis]|uniref:Uncharacterized protein n=1 Tax=Rhynchosporium secalis TaxID=38038 RepID=A0A1E1MEL3_RHYSE|nr:uncharacterized protein RSE6_08077 [Rhynchosporium secalis]